MLQNCKRNINTVCYVCTRCGHFIMKFSLNWESFYKQVVWHTWHCILMSLSNAREKNILKCSAIFSNVKMWDPIILVMNLWTILITVEPLKAQVILWLESPPRGLGGDDNFVPLHKLWPLLGFLVIILYQCILVDLWS